MKIFIEINSIDNIQPTITDVEYVVGMKGISLRAPALFTLEELDQIISKAESLNQGVAINASKIIHEDELGEVRNILLALKDRKINHLFFSDLAVYMLANELKLDTKLIYNATTYLTSSSDVNQFLAFVDQVVVSPDLSLDEQIEIIKRAEKSCLLYAFGQYAIFHSKRNLLTNYFTYRHFDTLNPTNNRAFTIVEEKRSDHHRIVEDENGTHVFLAHFYCLLKEITLFEKPFDLYLSTNFLTDDQIKSLLKIYDELLQNSENREKLYNELLVIIPNLGEGIRNQKTYLLKGGD